MVRVRYGLMAWCAFGVNAVAGEASLTLASVFDGEHGVSHDLDGRFSPVEGWWIGAGAGHDQAKLAGQSFSGKAVRASTDLQWRSFMAGASFQQWKDAGQLRSRVLQGEAGWMADSGLALSALLADRNLRVDYSSTVLGQVRPRHIDLDGTGLGVDLSWFGEQWNVGLRGLDYRYGQSVQRVQAVLAAPSTVSVPRLQRLAESVATRAAAAPDREFSFTAGRRLGRSSLQGEVGVQRDALTHDQTYTAALVLGREVGRHLVFDATVGLSDGDAVDSVAYGGLSVTLRTAR